MSVLYLKNQVTGNFEPIASLRGVGVQSYVLVSGTHAPGTFDLYRMTMTDGTTTDVQVYNGANGSGDMTKSQYDPSSIVGGQHSTYGTGIPGYVAQEINPLDERVKVLEKQTTRLLYKINEDISNNEFYITGVKYTITGTAGALIFTDANGRVFNGDADDNVAIDNITYHFTASGSTVTHGARAATVANINAFVVNMGGTSPFRGIAVVIEETYHIWRYYPNTEGGVVIGWKDDGLDTVEEFSQTNSGILRGKQTAGYVEAEIITDPQSQTPYTYGKVNGFSDLTNRVTAAEGEIDVLQQGFYEIGTTAPTDKTKIWIDTSLSTAQQNYYVVKINLNYATPSAAANWVEITPTWHD